MVSAIMQSATAIPTLYYIPSRMMNAFAVGTKRDVAIGLTDGILRGLNLRELTGVLAHEMSHIRNNDMRSMNIADVVTRITNLFSTLGKFLLFFNLPLILINFDGKVYNLVVGDFVADRGTDAEWSVATRAVAYARV
ncbi:MAG: M48 family metalloprotease [Caldilineaceae bacterium]|nr:M48 family metalloprotease [Caldilineaceae bacterium]